VAEYVPRKGGLVALPFDPQSGHEQRGRCPALVVSNDLFNVDQVKSIDFRSQKAKRIGRAPLQVLDETLSILDACIY